MIAASTPISLRNLSNTVRISSKERQQPLRHRPDNTNRKPPTPPKTNGLPAFRSPKVEDGKLIMSDIHGQDFYGHCNGIIDDIKNYKLDTDDAEGCYSSAGQEKGESAEKSKIRKVNQ